MKRLAILTSLMTLPACTTLNMDDATPAERFVPITDISPEIAHAQKLIQKAGNQFDVKPYPEFRIVSDSHPILGGIRRARAVVFESGTEALYLAKDQLIIPDLRMVIDHEMAHFAAWRQFGHDIHEHGSEWRAVCMANASRDACRTIR